MAGAFGVAFRQLWIHASLNVFDPAAKLLNP